MRKALFPLALLAFALTLPLTARADAVDQFTFNSDTAPTYKPVHLTIDLPASPPPSPYTGMNGCAVDCFAVVGAVADGGQGAAIGAGVGAGVGAGSEIITGGDQVKVPSETLLDFTLQQEVSIPRRNL